MFGSDALRLLTSAILVATCANASAQAAGQAEKLDMELVGYHDLQGRSACQPLVHKQGERCKVAIQTNNVDVDDRGCIYIVDRANTGLHILELTGPARPGNAE